MFGIPASIFQPRLEIHKDLSDNLPTFSPPITCSFLHPSWTALWTLPRLHCWETWQTLFSGQEKLSSSFTEIFHHSERVYALPKEFTLGPFWITNSLRKFNIWFNSSKLDLLTFEKHVYSSVSLYVTSVSLKYVQNR